MTVSYARFGYLSRGQVSSFGEDGQQQVHGSRARYRKGCRCESCTAQESSYSRAYRLSRAEANR